MLPLGRPRSTATIIFAKEFRELFRDRRTLMSVVIAPLVITPGLFWLVGLLIGNQVEKATTSNYDVGVVNSAAAPVLAQQLAKLPHFRMHLDEPNRAHVEAAIKDRTLQAGLVFPAGAMADLRRGATANLLVLEDAGNESSQAAAGRLTADLDVLSQKLAETRLKAAHLPAGYANPLSVKQTPIRSGGAPGMAFLAMMLPYILTLSAFGGAIYAAFDQVAGEKERGTLETLLVAPAPRREIVLGKFGAVVAVCMVSCVLAIAGLVIAFSVHTRGMTLLTSGGGLHLSAQAVGVCLLVMLPLSILFAGVLLAVSTFARNQKEAQTYLAPLMMLVVAPAMSSMFLGTDAPRATALIPILGASLIIKQALSGSYDALFILLAFLGSVLWAGLALLLATRLFNNESVLIKA